MGKMLCPVDVISLCEADGQIRPLRVRFQDGDQVYQKFDIDRVIQRDQIRFVGAEAELFLCSATLGEKSFLIWLKYSLRSHSWCITGKLY